MGVILVHQKKQSVNPLCVAGQSGGFAQSSQFESFFFDYFKNGLYSFHDRLFSTN